MKFLHVFVYVSGPWGREGPKLSSDSQRGIKRARPPDLESRQPPIQLNSLPSHLPPQLLPPSSVTVSLCHLKFCHSSPLPAAWAAGFSCKGLGSKCFNFAYSVTSVTLLSSAAVL